MAEEKTNIVPELIKTNKSSSMFKPKVLLIGLPVFIVQLVAVYFITANILLSSYSKSASETNDESNVNKNEQTKQESPGKEGERDLSKNAAGLIYSLDDLIVNPANTNGKMLLLASVGLSVETEESKKILEEKQVIVKDAVISVLSGKNVNQLGSATYRDTLKTEILKSLTVQLPGSKVNNIYFSKFIIQ